MKSLIKFLIVPTVATVIAGTARVWGAVTDTENTNANVIASEVSVNNPDTNTTLKYPLPKINENNPQISTRKNAFHLNPSQGITTETVYDEKSNQYILQNKVGGHNFGTPQYMSVNDYAKYDMQKSMSNYWREKVSSSGVGKSSSFSLIPALNVGGKAFDKIFGGNTIEIRPSGSAELKFGILHNRRDDPSLDIRQRKVTNFNFDEDIQMNIVAKIGDKISYTMNYNTGATFDFENKFQLKYEGEEDEIIKLIEFGDVNLPISSNLIQGSQSLFGVKSQLQFGKTTITAVFSEQNAESQSMTLAGGAETNTFNIKADRYEENKHFFLSQYFYDHYNESLANLPIVSSRIKITKIEVWRTQVGAATEENRNLAAFADLGENEPYCRLLRSNNMGIFPDNRSNSIYSTTGQLNLNAASLRNISSVSGYLTSNGYVAGVDYEKVESARKLQPSEYTVNTNLGFISLNTSLAADQVLAVAFQYTIVGDTTVYQVGEFSSEVDAPNGLVVKLLKSTAVNTKIPMWNLMMKNVYSLNAYQVNNEDFRLNILYKGDEGSVPTGYFNEGQRKGVPLIRLVGADRIDTKQNPYPDGVYDFIDGAATTGGTIQAANGRIYFPVVEPFGKDLRAVLDDKELADKYCFDSLYTQTKQMAQQNTSKNKYYLEGMYKSSVGTEISLNAINIPEGSVKVSAGGITLTENVDYTVDYTSGRLKIINEGILNSGTPINVSFESSSMYAIQKKRMMGADIKYAFSDKLTLGGTIMHLSERPLTQKVNYGDEPIKNTIWGMNVAYETGSMWLTKMLDKLPFYSTKTESKLSFTGEFAHFIPGHSSVIGKTGTSYIDDFEATKQTIELRTPNSWFLASTPQGQTQANMFPQSSFSNLKNGYKRAKLAWYVIDPIFYDNNSSTPGNINKTDLSDPYVRKVMEQELFPYREYEGSIPLNISVLNLAYYPDERGPYNYEASALNANGMMKYPRENWGGIMRKIETTDFEAVNVEYIEFWMMDPFIKNPNHSGGRLYFNLGDISEDILRDGYKSFENGLPVDGDSTRIRKTVWGYVPVIQAVVNAFDNDEGNRDRQDVGYDGLSNEQEREFFANYLQQIANEHGEGSEAYQKALQDPSGDNYHYFRGSDYDRENVKVLERYKHYNGPDGNSPSNSNNPESYPTSGTSLPNVEDINLDNTLSEDERYYQYYVELAPDKMNVGENYINDIYEAHNVKLADGSHTDVKWYQFKIPVREPSKVVGNLQGFNSIRFMRMFFKDFDEPIVCRFATLELVKGDWRKYTGSLLTNGDYAAGGLGGGETTFNVSSLSLEENGHRVPIPYMLPPGIERETQYYNTTSTQLNEQSMTMKVQQLMDGDARAVYKTTDFDFRRYKKLKMYIHAEKVNENDKLEPNDVTVFIRLGSDFSENYYEYEMPIDITAWGTVDRKAIWPDKNRMDIVLDKLVNAKLNRAKQIQNGATFTLTNPYTELDGDNLITVVGSPTISDVATIMIGVRNPKKRSLNDNDDMLPKSVEVWVNELRLTDFNDENGWAATGTLRATLADLGDVTLTGATMTPHFGSLEQNINETSDCYTKAFDVATNIEFGKFFPEKWNLKLPVHYDYSLSVSTPEYDPLNPDTKMQDEFDYLSKSEKKKLKERSQDFTQRRNFNMMNVRKERGEDNLKQHIYDVENFDVSYAYSQTEHRDIDVQNDTKTTHTGSLGYNYTLNPKNYKPFSKVKLLSSKHLALIRDFNFYLLPKSLAFRTDIRREFNEYTMRNKSIGLIPIQTTYVKAFDWTRTYGLRWDLSQNLRLEYNATALAWIDEPAGKLDTKAKRDSVWQNALHFGRMNNYSQTANVSYQLPLNKIPVIDWLSANVRYASSYNWAAAPTALTELGNTINNTGVQTYSGTINMTNLYNKVPYLKKLNQTRAKNNNKNLNKKPVRKKLNENGEEEEDDVEKEKEKEPLWTAEDIKNGTLKFLMMLKSVSLTYSINNGATLPGFTPSPDAVGMNFSNMSPGWDFVFGGGYNDILSRSVNKGWLTTSENFTSPFLHNNTKTFDARATIEPFKDLRIELKANRTYTERFTTYCTYSKEQGEFVQSGAQTTGTFSISFLSINTAFLTNDKYYSNSAFQNFLKYRLDIAQRLAARNPNSQGAHAEYASYPEGYGPTSQDVLIPAFLAAYAGKSSGSVRISDPFPTIPMPNWRITYNGLAKLKAMQKIFQSFSLASSYQSTYSVGSFSTNLNYREDADGMQYIKDALGNYMPKYEIAGAVSIAEQFNPLISVDMGFKNSMTARVEYKKGRNLSLAFSNNQLTENTSKEWIFGAGYRFKDVKLTFNFGGERKTYKSDINVKADVSIRDNMTILRKIVEEQNTISSGQRVISISFSSDYQLSQNLTVKFYYEQVLNKPHISNQFPTSNIDAGFSLRFTLGG